MIAPALRRLFAGWASPLDFLDSRIAETLISARTTGKVGLFRMLDLAGDLPARVGIGFVWHASPRLFLPLPSHKS
jgi:hypothetical protein